MTDNPSPRRVQRAALFLATVWTLTTCIFLIDANLFSQRERFQESDFIMTFYVAGRLVLSGRSSELYPPPGAASFVGSPFDQAAHEFLPHLPKASIGAYMYTPLVAGFFAPLSLLGPNGALLIWQVLSVLALAVSSWCLGTITAAKPGEIFFLSSLYFPVFLTLWAGQLGLAFGLLPLSAGFFLLLRGWPLAAGATWALLLLKPQYFLAAAFVSLALAWRRRPQVFLGMAMGVIALLGLTAIAFSPQLVGDWLRSHRVSDSIFSAGLHGIPAHLITGLPANLMILFPSELRNAVKWPLYAAAALLWLAGFIVCLRLARARLGEQAWISLALIVGVMLCALTLPHLLYYDLCVLLPAGVLLSARNGPLAGVINAGDLAGAAWLAVSAFLPLLLAFHEWRVLPLLLELILLGLLTALVARLSMATSASASASHNS